MKSYSSRDIIKILKKNGWILGRITGSHHHFFHPVHSGKVTVPHPEKDLPTGTLKNILKQARINFD